MSITHAKSSTYASSTDTTLILSTDWNSAHTISQGYLPGKITLSTATPYTPVTGARVLFIEVWGGGGGGAGGGSGTASNAACGGGGGSGGYGALLTTSVSTSGYTFTCGTGGTAGTSGAVGSSGGVSTFAASASVVANGGGAGRLA